MRLLNTNSITLTEFYDENIPEYVILSHFWEKEEVLYKDIIDGTARSRAGYSKLDGCCQQAKQDGFEWVWIDTCCIDKTSSSELSEAINSMFKWYKSATVCYAYLADVTSSEAEKFTTSRWFTRGWTLQELIAPAMVEFYSREWTDMGTKTSLRHQISNRTGITSHILLGGDLSRCNIAEKMSWASERETSRIEDIAYCLLGIFDVNIPMLYGEGEKAFIRLQQEILSRQLDYTIFAWSHPWFQGEASILASHPSHFSRPDFMLDHHYSNLPPSLRLKFSGPYSKTIAGDYSELEQISPEILTSTTGIQGTTLEPLMMTSRGLRLTVLVNELYSNARFVFLNLRYKGEYLCIMEANELRHDVHYILLCDAEELKKFSYKSLYFDIKRGITHTPLPSSRLISSILRCIKLLYQHSQGDYTAKLLAVSTDFKRWIEPRTDLVLYSYEPRSVFCIALFRFIHKKTASHPKCMDRPNQDGVVAVAIGQKHLPICIIHQGSASVENLQKLFELYSGSSTQEVVTDRAEKLAIDQAKELAVDRDACYINCSTIVSATVRRISGSHEQHNITHSLSVDIHRSGHSPAWVRSSLEFKTLPES